MICYKHEATFDPNLGQLALITSRGPVGEPVPAIAPSNKILFRSFSSIDWQLPSVFQYVGEPVPCSYHVVGNEGPASTAPPSNTGQCYDYQIFSTRNDFTSLLFDATVS